MTSQPGSAAKAETAGARGVPVGFRIIPQLDRNPRAVAYAQTLRGRILLFAAFAVLLQLTSVQATSPACYDGAIGACLNVRRILLALPILVAIVAFGGRLRWWAVAFGGAIFLGAGGEAFPGRLMAIAAAHEGVDLAHRQGLFIVGVPLVVFLFSACLITVIGRYREVRIFQRPILFYLCLYALLVAFTAASVLRGDAAVSAWLFVGMLGFNFPIVAYALIDLNMGDRRPLAIRAGLATFHRLWGYTQVPFGKGAAYLARFEAKTPADLAVTQLKGLKLILWVLVLKIILDLFAFGAHDLLGLPRYTAAIESQVGGQPYPWFICWGSLIAEFIENLLRTASIGGGVFIALARMAGFRLLRNTYRPLESRTIADFWNRYLYYFKELLVDVFFYPTFLSCFRKHKRLRLVFATFMAACVGNMIVHFVRDIGFMAELGPAKAIAGFQTYAFYTFVLAVGISVSQALPRRTVGASGWLRQKALPSFRVLVFYCLLQIFDYEGRGLSLADHFRFFFHLFGLDSWI